MKRRVLPKALLALPLLAVAATAALAVQDAEPAEKAMPPAAEPAPEHAWLQQLVGEWDVTSEAKMGPGGEAMRMEFEETVRPIGDFWILGESKADFGGMPFTAIVTLGYDPEDEAFVGTWIDSMQPHLWRYRGSLDDAKRKLTLLTEGPSMEDPTKMAEYRDVIEVVSADHHTLTGSVRGDDGEWQTFVEADYRRRSSSESGGERSDG